MNIELANPPLKKATDQEKKSSSSGEAEFFWASAGDSLTSEEHLVWPTSRDIGRFSVCPKIDVNYPWDLKKYWFNLETFFKDWILYRHFKSGVFEGFPQKPETATWNHLGQLVEWIQLDNFTFTTWKVEGTSGTSPIYCCPLQIATFHWEWRSSSSLSPECIVEVSTNFHKPS